MTAPLDSRELAAERVEAESTRRIGFIIPSSNRRFEPEAAAFLPADVVPHIARARMTGKSKATPEVILERILDAARSLADARCELIFLHCTAHSTELGPKGELEMLKLIREATGSNSAATGLAIRAAFTALQAHTVAVVTPYDSQTTEAEVRYFEASGIHIAHVRAFDLAGSDAFCSTPATFWRDALAADRRHLLKTDAVLLSCANIRCLESLDAIEAAAGRPVVTSNQAVLWFGARVASVRCALPQLGCMSLLPLPSELPESHVAITDPSLRRTFG